jgi:GT2 family glycosyltransferase
MPDVTVAIATYRRPKGLARLLETLARLETDANLFVLVADNDAFRHEGYDLCRELCLSYRWPLDSFVVFKRGIAQVRNALTLRALQRTRMAYLAMLDDDGAADTNWLDAMLRAQCRTGADVVGGTVLPAFEVRPPRWAMRAPGIAPRRHPTGQVPMLHGTGNTLFTRAALERAGHPLFDPGYGLTGGEDKELFTRMRNAGARFAWCNEAVVREAQPASRLTVSWFCKRAYRIGNSDMRVLLQHRQTQAALIGEFFKIAGALISAPFLSVAFALAPDRRLEGLRLICRQAGKVAALFGRHYNEYAVTHGR